jgi:hypothetical protein
MNSLCVSNARTLNFAGENDNINASFRTLIKELQDYYYDKSVDVKPMRGVHTKAAGVPPLNSCGDKPSGKQVVARLPRVQQETTIDSEITCKF